MDKTIEEQYEEQNQQNSVEKLGELAFFPIQLGLNYVCFLNEGELLEKNFAKKNMPAKIEKVPVYRVNAFVPELNRILREKEFTGNYKLYPVVKEIKKKNGCITGTWLQIVCALNSVGKKETTIIPVKQEDLPSSLRKLLEVKQ